MATLTQAHTRKGPHCIAVCARVNGKICVFPGTTMCKFACVSIYVYVRAHVYTNCYMYIHIHNTRT